MKAVPATAGVIKVCQMTRHNYIRCIVTKALSSSDLAGDEATRCVHFVQ